MRAQAYSPLPARERSTASNVVKPAVGAGLVVVVAGLGWIYGRPRFAANDIARVSPISEPQALRLEPPAPAPVAAPVAAPAKAAAVDLAGSAAFKPLVIDHSGPAAALRPAWALAAPPQLWIWPRRIATKAGRRLSAWHPGNKDGRAFTFEAVDDNGLLQRAEPEPAQKQAVNVIARIMAMVAAQGAAARAAGGPMNIEDVRKLEAEALRKQKGAASVRGFTDAQGRPMAELMYKDGRREIVPYDPLVFDLKGAGVKTAERRTLFDLAASHRDDKIQWMNDLDEGTGILVFDADGSGRAGKTGAEVFGDRTDLDGVGRPTGFADGFAALRGLVDKAVKEGVLGRDVLDAGVLDADALAALEKAYGLRMKLGGFHSKTVSLAEAGVKAIALSSAAPERVSNFDGRRNDLLVQPGAVFLRADGSTGYYMNVWLAAKTGSPKLERN